MQHARELTKELNIVNEGLSQTDLPYIDRATLNSRRMELEGEISNFIGSNSIGQEVLEPAYFGNVKRELGDKLELAPIPIDGEWLPKSAVYSLVDLMVVIFGRPKGLFKECGKRIQSGLKTIQGRSFCSYYHCEFLIVCYLKFLVAKWTNRRGWVTGQKGFGSKLIIFS